MSTTLLMHSATVQAGFARLVPRLFIGISVLLLHGAGLMYVQAVDAGQVTGASPALAQPLQCERPRGGEFA